MRFSIAAIALVATAVSAQYPTTTVTSYAASNATSSVGPTVYST